MGEVGEFDGGVICGAFTEPLHLTNVIFNAKLYPKVCPCIRRIRKHQL